MKRAGLALVLFVVGGLLAAPPEIAAVRGGGAVRMIHGVGFVPGAVEVRSWTPPADDMQLLESLAAPAYSSRALLPTEPPADAVKGAVLEVDAQGLALAAVYDGPVCWVRNADGWSKPALLGAPKPLVAWPATLHPNDTVRVYGESLLGDTGSRVALRAADGSQVLPIEPATVSTGAAGELLVKLPADLPVGSWQVWVHNGTGGVAGWGGPLPIRVTARPPAPINVTFVDARLHGSRGNGIVDETNSLRQALVVASKTKDTVVLPPGRFPLRGTLEIPPGVSLVGAGPGNTVIEVPDDQPFVGGFPIRADLDGVARDWQDGLRRGSYAPMIWLRDQSTLANVTLECGPGASLGVMVAASPGTARDVRIERCHIRCGGDVAGDLLPATSVLIAGDTERLVLRDCQIDGHDGVAFLSASNTGAMLARNTIRSRPHGSYTGLALRGLTDSVVVENRIEDGGANLTIDLTPSRGSHELAADQRIPAASVARNVLANNVLLGGGHGPTPSAPPRPQAATAYWKGQPKACDDTTLTVDGEPFWTGISDSYVVVTGGRGVGQYRRVISNTANTVTVSPAWEVALDATSQVVIDGCVAENLWLNQRDERSGPWDYLRSMSVGNLVAGLDLRGGGTLDLVQTGRPAGGPLAYNRLSNCSVDRGAIRLVGARVVGNVLAGVEVRADSADSAITVESASQPAEPGLGAAWNLLDRCAVRGARFGIQVRGAVSHLVLHGNRIAAAERPLADETGQVVQR